MGLLQQEIQKRLRGNFGRELIVYDIIDSTNNAAKLLAKNGAAHGSVVVAKQQTAGRGRLGRSFFSPKETGIYMTLILRPKYEVSQAQLLTAAAAVAVAKAIETVCQLQVSIKWVNDLLYQGKKICGILAESSLCSDGTLDYIVLGIGINVRKCVFPPELIEIASDLESCGGKRADLNELTAEILNLFDDIYREFALKTFLEEYRNRSCVLGNKVWVLETTGKWPATAETIDDQARLTVQDEAGVRHVMGAGEISLRVEKPKIKEIQ